MKKREQKIEKGTGAEREKEVIEGEREEPVIEQVEGESSGAGGEELKKRELEEARNELEGISEEEEGRKLEEKETEAERRKSEAIKEVAGERIPELFKELFGDDSEEAWEKRKELEGKEPMYTAASLAGVASDKSREWLNQNKEKQKLWWGISRGLIGDDSKEAWKIRNWLKVDQKVKRVRGERWSLLKKSLGLHKSERIFNLREKIKLPGWYEPGDVVVSTLGLKSEEARRLQEEFEDIAPAEVLMSLAGNNSEWAQRIREKYKGDKRLRWAYEKSLAGSEA